MPTIVVDQPEPIITLEEAKRQLRRDAVDDDDFISDLIAGVTAHLDGPAGNLGRAIGVQTLEEQRRSFPRWGSWYPEDWFADVPLCCQDDRAFIVRYGPIISLVEIAYVDQNGIAQTLDLSLVEFDDTRIEPIAGTDWPFTQNGLKSVRVRYVAGYEQPPLAIKRAILLMIGTLYANREATIESAFLGAAGNLLHPFQRIA